jgi:hypothetical protein
MLDKNKNIYYIARSLVRRDVRAVEGARLESVCTLIAYPGFESLSLRQKKHQEPMSYRGLFLYAHLDIL